MNAFYRTALVTLSAIIAFTTLTLEQASAVQRSWISGANNEWNTTNGTPWTGGIAPVAGDTVRFPGSGTVFIGSGGVAQDVFVGGEMLLTNGGGTYNFSGGNILDFGATPAFIRNVWDTRNHFNYGTSLGFTGGTFIGDAAATNKGFINYNLSQSSGAYHFGTGTITLGPKGSEFVFNPLAGTAQLTNNFVIQAQSSTPTNVVIGPNNPLGSTGGFTGNFTLNGNLTILGQNAFNNTLTLTGDRTLTLGTGNNGVVFNGNIDGGGIHSITLASNDAGQQNPTDWSIALAGPGGWNVKNVIKTNSVQKLRIDGDQKHFFDGVKANGGEVIVAAGWLTSNNSTASAVYNITADYNVFGDVDGAGAKLAAEIRASFAGSAGSAGSGTINVGALDGVTVLSGSVRGNGVLRATTININNQGVLRPGDSAGNLTIGGNAVFNTGSTLEIELGGLVAGVSYDQLDVTGSTQLGGTLDVRFINNFYQLVSNSDTFTIIDGASISGMFSNVVGGRIDTSDGRGSFQVSLVGGDLLLSNFEAVPVPEPSSVLLLGLGTLSLVPQARRRQRGKHERA